MTGRASVSEVVSGYQRGAPAAGDGDGPAGAFRSVCRLRCRWICLRRAPGRGARGGTRMELLRGMEEMRRKGLRSLQQIRNAASAQPMGMAAGPHMLISMAAGSAEAAGFRGYA